jgi:hypothetical protein
VEKIGGRRKEKGEAVIKKKGSRRGWQATTARSLTNYGLAPFLQKNLFFLFFK